MRAVVINSPGGPEELQVRDVPDPRPRPEEVVVAIAATAVNRADIGQRRGNHPPPPGASPYPGLECSGTIDEVGDEVAGWQVGDRVIALLAGGGYAERVAVPAAQLMPAPANVSLVDAAGLPETCCTVHSMVFAGDVSPGRLRPGETLLVHGGASGIGTTAIQLATAHGARVVVTVGNAEKATVCRELGAELTIDYHRQDFAHEVRQHCGGADMILDIVGAPYLAKNLETLAARGRLIMIGQLGGNEGIVNLAILQEKWATLHAGGLRARPPEAKASIVAATHRFIEPLLRTGQLRPVIDRIFDLADAPEAHRLVESSQHIGKVLIRPIRAPA